MRKLHVAALNISIITALALFGDSLLYLVLPLYAEQLGVPLVMVGVVLSVNRWIRLYSNHLAANTYARFSLYTPLLITSIVAAISTGMYAFPIGIIGFLIARIAWGVCWSYFRMGSYLVVLQTSQGVLGWALGLTQAIARLGSAFAAIVGGYLIDLLGYQQTMLGLALLSAVAIPLAFMLKHQLPPMQPPTETGAGQDFAERPFTRQHSLSVGFCYASGFITFLISSGLVTSSLSLVLQGAIGDGLSLGVITLGIGTVSGLVFASNWLSAIVVSSAAGRFSDRHGRTLPFVVATVLQGLVLFTLAMTPSPWLSVIAAILFFILTNIQRVALDAALGDATTHENRHSVVARYSSYQDFGAALGPLLGYGVGVYLSFNHVYLLGAVALLLTASAPLVQRFRRVKLEY